MLNFKPPMERNIGELQLEQAYNSKQQSAMTSSYRLCIEASNTSLGLNASSLAKQTPWSCESAPPASVSDVARCKWCHGEKALAEPLDGMHCSFRVPMFVPLNGMIVPAEPPNIFVAR